MAGCWAGLGFDFMSLVNRLPPRHGGDPQSVPLAPDGLAMMDLATGVNPWSWPVSPPPAHCYQVLPYPCPELRSAAAAYYGVAAETILATAGSQPVIQILPTVLESGRVLLAEVAYEEHRYRWSRAGHALEYFSDYSREHIAKRIIAGQIRYLLIISPNNPTGDVVSAADVRYWRSLLPSDGVVVIDQAFADAMPSSDLRVLAAEAGIVLLRSVGKFFGLPGLRLGFVIAEPYLLAELNASLGPWTVCGSAQWLGRQALLDRSWHVDMQAQLLRVSEAQGALLERMFAPYFDKLIVTPLFITMVLPLLHGDELQQRCFERGVSVRVYRGVDTAFVRWGLAQDQEMLAERLSGICLRGLAA